MKSRAQLRTLTPSVFPQANRLRNRTNFRGSYDFSIKRTFCPIIRRMNKYNLDYGNAFVDYFYTECSPWAFQDYFMKEEN